MIAEAVIEQLEHVATHDLVEAVGHRLSIPNTGTAKLELTFNDGEWVGSNYIEKVKPTPRSCICRRHGWNPDCPEHPPSVM